MTSPELLAGVVYQPNHTHQEFPYTPTSDDEFYMDLALDEARIARVQNDSPIGAVLVGPNSEVISDHTTEFSTKRLLGHAEMNVIEAANERFGRYLGSCILYTTAEPCPGCAYFIDKGEIGMLIVAASREDAPDFFRKRSTTLHSMWSDSRRTLTVVKGLRRVEAAALLTADAKRH